MAKRYSWKKLLMVRVNLYKRRMEQDVVKWQKLTTQKLYLGAKVRFYGVAYTVVGFGMEGENLAVHLA